MLQISDLTDPKICDGAPTQVTCQIVKERLDFAGAALRRRQSQGERIVQAVESLSTLFAN